MSIYWAFLVYKSGLPYLAIKQLVGSCCSIKAIHRMAGLVEFSLVFLLYIYN